MKTYRSLRTVEAVQVTMENRNEVAAWCGQGASAGIGMGSGANEGERIAIVWFKPGAPGTYVPGQDTRAATQGYWIVRDEAGFLTPWSDEEFRAAWEEHG